MLSADFDLNKLRAVSLFTPLSPDALELLRPSLAVAEREVGAVVFEEGAPPTTLWILLDGEVHVIRGRGTDDERLIAVIDPPGEIGDMSVITGEARGATVVTTQASRFLTLSKAGLEDVLLQYPEICLQLLREACRRVKTVLELV